jgi:hypothetical protein
MDSQLFRSRGFVCISWQSLGASASQVSGQWSSAVDGPLCHTAGETGTSLAPPVGWESLAYSTP